MSHAIWRNGRWKNENENENSGCCKCVTGFGTDGIGGLFILEPEQLLLPILYGRSCGGGQLGLYEGSPRQSAQGARRDRQERRRCPPSARRRVQSCDRTRGRGRGAAFLWMRSILLRAARTAAIRRSEGRLPSAL